MKVTTYRATIHGTSVTETIREHPLWSILTVSIIVFGPILGHVIGGIASILFGWISGGVGFYAGYKAITRVIEKRST